MQAPSDCTLAKWWWKIWRLSFLKFPDCCSNRHTATPWPHLQSMADNGRKCTHCRHEWKHMDHTLCHRTYHIPPGHASFRERRAQTCAIFHYISDSAIPISHQWGCWKPLTLHKCCKHRNPTIIVDKCANHHKEQSYPSSHTWPLAISTKWNQQPQETCRLHTCDWGRAKLPVFAPLS